jgi:hypothetical protein
MNELDPTIIAMENSWEVVTIIKPPQSGNKRNLLHSWSMFANRENPYVMQGYIVRDKHWNRLSILSSIYKSFEDFKVLNTIIGNINILLTEYKRRVKEKSCVFVFGFIVIFRGVLCVCVLIYIY